METADLAMVAEAVIVDALTEKAQARSLRWAMGCGDSLPS